MLLENNLTLKRFCEISDSNYNTASCWQRRNEPRIHGKIEIARAMEKLGLGEYSENLKTIKKICKY